jgi:hypothetical protein
MFERCNLNVGGAVLSLIDLTGEFVKLSYDAVQGLGGAKFLLLTLQAAPQQVASVNWTSVLARRSV